MLVIQRSLRKSASFVESREQTHQYNRRCLSCIAEGKCKKSASAPNERRSDANRFHYSQGSSDICLQGQSVPLQRRLSSKTHIVHQLNAATPLLSKDLVFISPQREKRAAKNKYSSVIKTEPTPKNIINEVQLKKTILQQKKRKVRTPLHMNTMSLPNEKHATMTSKEATQRHLSREDVQATLDRLLATQNHQSQSISVAKHLCAADETLFPADVKFTYLQDSYDYLYYRHLQNLNSVINTYSHQEGNETIQNNQIKKRIHIHQNCCGGNECLSHVHDEFQLETNHTTQANVLWVRTKSKSGDFCTHHTYQNKLAKNHKPQKERCEEIPRDHTEIDNNRNILSRTSEDCKLVHRAAVFSEDHAANFRSSSRSSGAFEASSSAMESRNVKATSSADTSGTRASSNDKKNTGFLCINVSNQFQDIHLEEVEPAVSKPVITLNHVSESFSGEKREVSVARADRSPSPLLVVPPPTDLQQESLRPPLD